MFFATIGPLAWLVGYNLVISKPKLPCCQLGVTIQWSRTFIHDPMLRPLPTHSIINDPLPGVIITNATLINLVVIQVASG